MPLVVAAGPLLDHIFDHTFPVWNEGLTRAAYGQWNKAQLRTPWGSRNLHRFALLADDGSLLASAKRYRIDVSLDGRDGWMAGIGAVFTPESRRGQGHATRLIEMLIERERADGAMLASLFSEIGAEFYARLGFRTIPLDEVTVTVKRKDGAPAMLVRGGEERDLADIAVMHATRTASVRFALRRDPALLGYALSKKRLLAGLGPSGLRQVEFFVAEEGRSAVAYVVLSENANGWTLEEAGDRDPAGARLGAMLQVMLARHPAEPVPEIKGWWPHGFVPPQMKVVASTPTQEVLMIRPLRDRILPLPPLAAAEVVYWHADYF